MRNFLNVRIESLYRITGKHSAVSQLFHDLRIRKPDYIKEPAVRLYFPGEVGKETPVELREEDIERLRKRKDALQEYLQGVEMQMHERFENMERGENKQHQRWQANTKPFSSGVLTFSELARNVDIDKLWEYGLKSIQALGEKYKIKVLWVALHTDETTPHFHYMFENLNADGRTFQRQLGRDGCSKLQTFYGEQLQPLGFQRGIKKKLSGAEHQDIMESHFIAREKLKGEVKTLQKGIDVLSEKIGASTGILEGILSQKEEILISIEDLQAERQKIMDSLDELETERKKLRRSRDELKQQTAAEKAQTTALQQELRQKRTALKEDLNEIIQKIEIVKQDNERRKAIAVEVMKENAQEEDDKIQGKIDRYGLQDLYYFLKRVSHHGQLYVQAQGKTFYSNREYWDERRLTTPNEIISTYRDLLEQNTCGQTDWHLRILGMRPLFVMDDMTLDGIEQLRRDGLAPFATVETSPSNFHAYVQLNLKKRQMLTEIEWNALNSYLIQQYNADKGANTVEHAFRLPIGSSHKHHPPFELQLRVFEDAQPAIDADTLLQRLPADVFQKAERKLNRRYDIQLDGSDAPDWFQQNWKKRREDLIKSGRAPIRQNGTVDDSSVDFIVSRDILSVYKDKRSERLLPMLNFCHCMLMQEAESRQKARPDDYAVRTLNAVIDRVQLPIKKKTEVDLEI